MAVVQDTTAVAASNTAAKKTGATSSIEEGQDRFLKLLVTQMRNQDPLNPLDNAQVTSQMAQISTVNGIDKLNSTISGMSAAFLSSQSLQAASLIGHDVLAPGKQLSLANGTAVGGVALSEPADKITVKILDKSGNTLQAVDLGPGSGGVMAFQWDGATTSGAIAAPGKYTFKVEAVRDGKKINADALGFGHVDSVSLGKELMLNSRDLGTVSMSQIKQVL